MPRPWASHRWAGWVDLTALAAVCMGLAALTLALPSAPGYDSWAWIVWGREVLHGDLRTVSGPSWKPFPIFFTAPLSLAGGAAPDLWLLITRAATFGAVVAAAAVGTRLAGRVGGVVAGALLLFSPSLWGAIWGGYSEGILILCLLAAVDRHLAGRLGQAFWLGVAAALLRPEAWPFLGVYALWLVVRDRGRLGWVAVGLGLVPALWLLPELWGSGSLWRAAERAQLPGPDAPAFASRPALAVLENSLKITPAVVRLGLLVGVVVIALRRLPRVALEPALGLAGFGLAWLLLVAVMTEAGFSGISRYLLAPLAVAHVLAGAALGGALATLLRPSSRSTLSVGLACVLGALVIAGVVRNLAVDGRRSVDDLRFGTAVTNNLDDAVADAGGERRLTACGGLYASYLATPLVAWTFERHLEEVTATPRAPGAVLRAQVHRDEPIDPPRDALAGAPGRKVIARSEHWEVEVACGGRDPGSSVRPRSAG